MTTRQKLHRIAVVVALAATWAAAWLAGVGTPDTYTVDRIVDGDTIDVTAPTDGATERVRLLAIDTPEVYGGVECGGREASAYVAGLAPPGTHVKLHSDGPERDRYGRRLAVVKVDGEPLNLAVVQAGWATVEQYQMSDVGFAPYQAAESAARAEGAGMWGACTP